MHTTPPLIRKALALEVSTVLYSIDNDTKRVAAERRLSKFVLNVKILNQPDLIGYEIFPPPKDAMILAARPEQ